MGEEWQRCGFAFVVLMGVHLQPLGIWTYSYLRIHLQIRNIEPLKHLSLCVFFTALEEVALILNFDIIRKRSQSVDQLVGFFHAFDWVHIAS